METDPDLDKKDVRRPMNAFLIFCKRHRSMVREKNPHLDNRSVTRILGDLWANIGDEEKIQYTDLAKQYKDAFMKANPDYKWHNPERMAQLPTTKLNSRPTNERVPSVSTYVSEDGPIVPGKLADPSNMGGLSMLMEGIQVKSNQFSPNREPDHIARPVVPPIVSPVTSTPPFYPWVSQQDLDLDYEKKLVIDEGVAKPDNKLDVNSSVKHEQVIQGTDSQRHFTDPDQETKNTVDPDEAIYSYGKVVMDHIIDKLYLSTIKNIGSIAKPVTQTVGNKKSPLSGTREVIKPPPSLPVLPSQGKKSYHTSIAVRNLLEFTRRAAAREEGSTGDANVGYIQCMKQNDNKEACNMKQDTKQKLKDFCLKKEGRPKVVNSNEASEDSLDGKEFKRKRCYSESCAELYKNQDKRIKLESDQIEEDQKSRTSSNEDYQPTRKSRRRNRGQRYQELINEGIIQPSKARLAAMKTDTNLRNISFKEAFFSRRADELGDEVLSVYPRQIRKRTMSESEKNRTSFDEASRYRTGDFDLEAQIKTLPACSLEKVVRPKRTIGKSSLSESDTGNTLVDGLPLESTDVVPEIKLTVPPHLKAKPQESTVPVVGSRKRKARKHSITHLQPVKNDQPETEVAATLSGLIKMDKKGTRQGFDPLLVKQGVQKTSLTGIESCDRKEIGQAVIDTVSVKKCVGDDNNDGCNSNNKDVKYDCAKTEKTAEHLNETRSPCRNSMDYQDKLTNTEHSSKNKETGEILCNLKFTKLKESCELTNGTDLSSLVKEDTSDKLFDSCYESNSRNNNNFKDQDENSNETDYCNHRNRNSSSIFVENTSMDESVKDDLDNLQCENEDNITIVTAVSMSVPVEKADICLGNSKTESGTEHLQDAVDSNVPKCDISSAVTLTTLQSSLTCQC